MCGIIAYVGRQQAAPLLLEGLRRLEYRGYDSAGIAVLDDKLEIRKAAGKLRELENLLAGRLLKGCLGIGHTRWATHGPPSTANAHPHADCRGRIAVVHNGIIENYLALRRKLEAEGHRFRSETDTEVIPHLLEAHYRGDLLAALQATLRELEGSFAIVAVCADEPGRLVVARRHSPLLVGLDRRENWAASDLPALMPHTRRTYVLDDGETAALTADRVSVCSRSGRAIRKPVFHIRWDAARAARGGYKHFMLKEIHEQPEALRETLAPRLHQRRAGYRLELEEIGLSDSFFRRLEKIVVIACGTAFHAGLAGKHMIEALAKVPVEVEVASELRYQEPLVNRRTLGLVISQSGETADTLAAMREAKRHGAKVITCTNVVGSSAAREADGLLYTYAGPEIAVASTKAYTSQMAALGLLALHLARVRETASEARLRAFARALLALPDQAAEVLRRESEVKACASHFLFCQDFLFLGRGPNYASALEGALKLKEISYLHAEGYAAGEMKHGPIAIITPQVATVAIAAPGKTYVKMLGNLQEVRARGGRSVAIAFDGDDEIRNSADYLLNLPPTEELLSPILAALPLQSFAYFCADQLGCDIDQPRNLAKSVTVE